MSQDPLEVFNKGFGEFLESTSQLEKLFTNTVSETRDPEVKEALGQFLDLLRSTHAQVKQELPGEIAVMFQGVRHSEVEFAGLVQQKDQLVTDIEALQVKGREAMAQAEARQVARAAAPKQPGPADLARGRLAAQAQRQQSGQASPTPLKGGEQLLQQLLAIGRPEVVPQPSRGLGNIWEFWEEAAAKDAAEDAARDARKRQ